MHCWFLYGNRVQIFLYLPIERWPIWQDYTESTQLPDTVGITMSFELAEKDKKKLTLF